jgi:hypothetical protein
MAFAFFFELPDIILLVQAQLRKLKKTSGQIQKIGNAGI